jgi:hypothetical protein
MLPTTAYTFTFWVTQWDRASVEFAWSMRCKRY